MVKSRLWLGALAISFLGTASGDEIAPAIVGNRPISSAELSTRFADQSAQREHALNFQLQRLRLQYERDTDSARRALLESMIDERLLQLEAAARRVSIDELLSSVVPEQVTTEEISAAAARARPSQSESHDPELIERMRQQLEQQARSRAVRALLQQLAVKYDVRMQLEPRRESVSLDDSPTRGAIDAKVTIVEFADFQCPYCLKLETALRRVLAEHPQDVRLVFKQLPIPELHPDAERLARGAVCAGEQGKFWELHDALLDNPGRVDQGRMLRLAHDAGVDTIQLDLCTADTARTQATLSRDLDEANALAIGGTPALFVNGRMFQGAISYETLTSVINEELRAHRRVEGHNGSGEPSASH
jgi:protein-disulfide isomerase